MNFVVVLTTLERTGNVSGLDGFYFMSTPYELLYIVAATYTDEELSQIESKVKALLEKQTAVIDSITRLGKFRFAYPINKARHGHYIQVRFSVEPQAVPRIEAALRITSEVLRGLLLRLEEVGGDKFDLIQFTEVNVENREPRDDRARRRPTGEHPAKKFKPSEALKSVVIPELSAEELEKKIDAALSEEKA